MRPAYSRYVSGGALAGFMIFFWLFAAPQRPVAADDERKTNPQKPFVFSSALTSGKKAGTLVLGETTFEEAVKMYPAPPFEDYDGALRPIEKPPVEGMSSIRYVYNPWQTMYSLFFDSGRRLVMVSELYELGSFTESELHDRYPGMVETDSSQGSIEYQLELQECAAVIARVETAGRTVEQLSYAYTCE